MKRRRAVRSGHLLRDLRIAVLLLVLLAVALGSWQARHMATDWKEPLWIAVHPLNGDGSTTVDAALAALEVQDFLALEAFFTREARRYGITLESPVTLRLAPRLHVSPPLPPRDRGLLATAWWSLRLRWWSFGIGRQDSSPPADIRLYARYFDSTQVARLDHSLGLQEGRIGILNLFAGDAYTGRNHVVIAHETLHTLGATDKYDPASNLPRYPDGYAAPHREPRHPQSRAEIMGGRIPLTADRARMPETLDEVMVGTATAREIRWSD